MAATGYTPIQLYYSTTAAAVPTAGNLASGELAINITDGKLYYKSNAGTVTLIAGTGGAGVVAGSNTQVQFNNSGVFGASANMTFDGTTLTVAGLSNTGNTTLGNASADTVTVNGTITSNLIFTDNTYDIGASGATRPRTGYFGTSIFTPLLDATNVEVTNIKALDGTASATIANSTGVMTIGSSILTTTDINGGTIDGTTIGANVPAVGVFTNLRVGTATSDELLTINGSSAGFIARITNTTASNPNGLYINSTNAIGTGSALRVDSQGVSLLTLNTTGVTLAGGLTAGSTVDILGSSWLKFASVNTLFSTTGVGFFLQAPDISTTPLTIRGNSGATWATVSSSGAAITGTLTTTGVVSLNGANLPASTSLALAGAMCLGATTSTTGDYLSSGGGNSTTYNGLAILSNSRSIATQANTGLSSWIVDVGGRAADGSTYNVNTANKFRVAYVAAGGSYYNATNFFAITSAGNVGINNISPTVRFEANGGENEALTMTSLAGAQGAIGYNQGEIRECGFNVNNASNTVISDISTTSTGWRVVFRGTWSNNYEGSGLSFYAPYIELNAANPSTIIGSRTLTVSRNGSGFLIVNSSDANRISFAGTVEVYENPQSPQPEQSMRLLGGIQFPATQNATSQANTLDDYEEGTWTPEIKIGGSSTGITYSSRGGYYRKIGSTVFCTAQIQLSSKGSNTGDLTLNAFPFTTDGTTASRGGGAFTYFHNSPALTNAGSLFLLVESGDTRSVLRYYNTSTGLSVALSQANVNDTTEFFFSFTYIAAS